jgi:outer membrane lipase/esterase
MRFTGPVGAAVAFAAIISAPAAGAATRHHTYFGVFGDSLSDDGNLFAADGGVYPVSPPYFDGRFSNGPVWAEGIAAEFDGKGLDTGNFAFGAARALPTDENNPVPPELGFDVPDLPDQIANFAASGAILGARPVASLFFGANDIIFNGLPIFDPIGVAVAAANAVADGALSLAGLGISDFVIFNLPDLGKTPAFSLFQPPEAAFAASAATVTFNTTLDARIDGLRSDGLKVVKVDMFGLLDDLFADPEAFGVTDVKLPCLFPNSAAAAAFAQPLLCQGEDQTDRAFFDSIHPNYVIHDQIAAIVGAQIAPVPLPLPGVLLFAGIAALAAVCRRA